MIGPSSSHTAGALRIAKIAKKIFNENITWARIHLYESFAKTFKGHGTDLALVGGLLGFDTDDKRINQSLKLAKNQGISITFLEDTGSVDHPNTVRILIGNETNDLEVVGISIGGGKVEIKELNGFILRLSGNHPAILIMHNDHAGAIASVTKILAKHQINIGHMEVNRKDIRKDALMIIEVDQNVDGTVLRELEQASHINQVSTISS